MTRIDWLAPALRFFQLNKSGSPVKFLSQVANKLWISEIDRTLKRWTKCWKTKILFFELLPLTQGKSIVFRLLCGPWCTSIWANKQSSHRLLDAKHHLTWPIFECLKCFGLLLVIDSSENFSWKKALEGWACLTHWATATLKNWALQSSDMVNNEIASSARWH